MITTHRKKPTEVTLIKLSVALELDSEIEGLELREVREGYEIYNKLHQSWIKLDLDDYINISTVGDFYPIKKSIVESTYEAI